MNLRDEDDDDVVEEGKKADEASWEDVLETLRQISGRIGEAVDHLDSISDKLDDMLDSQHEATNELQQLREMSSQASSRPEEPSGTLAEAFMKEDRKASAKKAA